MTEQRSELRRFVSITGVVCVLLGVALVVTDATRADDTVPAAAASNGAFGAGLLIGLGLLWLHASRQNVLPLRLINILASTLLLGAVGRIVATTISGWPGWWPATQIAVEIVVPGVVLLLARHEARHSQGHTSPSANS